MLSSNLHFTLTCLYFKYNNELLIYKKNGNYFNYDLIPIIDIDSIKTAEDYLDQKTALEYNISFLIFSNDLGVQPKPDRILTNEILINEPQKKMRNYRLLRKFIKNPYQYFFDCKNPLERQIKYLFIYWK